MQPTDAYRKLKTTLRSNAIFSAISGLLLIFDAGLIGEFMGVGSSALYIGLGVVLLGFSASIFYNTTREQMNLGEAKLVAWMDVAWVLGSVLLLISPIAMSVGGKWLVAGVADVVALFAGFQFYFLAKTNSAGDLADLKS